LDGFDSTSLAAGPVGSTRSRSEKPEEMSISFSTFEYQAKAFAEASQQSSQV
jgi:hypothetical protein